MHFVLKCTLEPEFIERDFERPITDELFIGLENDIVAAFERTGDDFAKHLADRASGYSLAALISDAFDLLAKYAVGCLFIEKNQFDFKFLAEHYRSYRRRFLETMTAYLRIFIEEGAVRPLEHLELSTTLIIEILSWWAMDIRYTSFEPRASRWIWRSKSAWTISCPPMGWKPKRRINGPTQPFNF